MVNYDACEVTGRRSIGTVVDILLLTSAEAQISDNDIIAVGVDGIVAQRDAWGWSRLSKDGGIGTNIEIALECDDASHVEDDNLLR